MVDHDLEDRNLADQVLGVHEKGLVRGKGVPGSCER